MLTIRNNIAADATISARQTRREESLTSGVFCKRADRSDKDVGMLH